MTRLILMLLVVSVFASSLGVAVFADEETPEETLATDATDEVADEGEDKKNTVAVGGDSNNQKETVDDEELKKLYIEGFERKGEYADYYLEHIDSSKKLPEIVIDPNSYVSTTATVVAHPEFEGKKNVFPQ